MDARISISLVWNLILDYLFIRLRVSTCQSCAKDVLPCLRKNWQTCATIGCMTVIVAWEFWYEIRALTTWCMKSELPLSLTCIGEPGHHVAFGLLFAATRRALPPNLIVLEHYIKANTPGIHNGSPQYISYLDWNHGLR